MIVLTTKLADFVEHHRNWLSPIVALLGVAGGLCGAVPDSWAADPVARDLVAPAGGSWAGPTQGESVVSISTGTATSTWSRRGTAAPRGRSCATTATAPSPRSSRARWSAPTGTAISADFGSTTGGAPDGRPDIYCVVGACCRSQKNDLVFKLPSGGFSANVSSGRGVADIHGRGRDAVAADFNADGRMDIAVAN